MSIVVVTERHGEACLAADSLQTYGHSKIPARYLPSGEKIIQVGETWIGSVGWCVSLCVLKSVLEGELELPTFRTAQELFEFSRVLHQKLKDDYYLQEGDHASGWESSQLSLLFLNRHGLFGLSSNRTAEQYRRFMAIGSGAEHALGAMYAARALGASCEEMARLGVLAGAEFDQGCAQPITVKRMKLDAPPVSE